MGQTANSKPAPYRGPGTTLMKVPGILMIISGALSLISGRVTKAALTRVTAMANTAEEPLIARGFDSLSQSFTVSFFVAILTLTFGIVSIVFSRRPGQFRPVLIIGSIVIILTIVFNILYIKGIRELTDAARVIDDFNYSYSSPLMNFMGIASSLLLPGLSILGAWKNRQGLEA